MVLAPRAWRVLLGCCLVQVLATSAWGKPSRTDGRRSREEEAKKACAVGDVSKGIELLGELFVESDSLVFVHNQGRCYQQNGQWEKAINRFEEYLRKAPDLTAEDRSTVERYISECQAKIDKASASQTPAQLIQAVPTSAPVETEKALPQIPLPATAQHPGHGTPVGAIVTAAAGLVAVGVGVGFNFAERTLHNQMSDDSSKNTTDNENRRSTYQMVSIIGYSVGAAAIVSSAVLYVLGAHQDATSDDRVSFVAGFTPGTTSLGLKGRF